MRRRCIDGRGKDLGPLVQRLMLFGGSPASRAGKFILIFLIVPDLLISKFPSKIKRTGGFCKYCDFSTFEKEKTLKSDDFKVFLHSLELLVEISGIEPLTS